MENIQKREDNLFERISDKAVLQRKLKEWIDEFEEQQ